MKKLLSIEWLKLKDYNPFKVLSIFFVFGIVLVNVIVYQANKSIIEESLPKGQMFPFILMILPIPGKPPAMLPAFY